MDPVERLRLAAALAHSVPGVSLELCCSNGDTLTVASCRLDASLDPCQFRAAVLASTQPGIPRLVDAIHTVRVRHGLVHLGAGLYARRGNSGDERWFATTLGHEAIDALLAVCPFPAAHRTMEASLRVDTELGVTSVRLTSTDRARGEQLDEVAAWVLSTCLVEELIAACRSEVSQ